MIATTEEAVVFDCEGDPLVGIVHRPQRASRRGVLVVVGGPQYRVGSHRQFLLLARRLSSSGFPVMRFDHRGFGDSAGPRLGFEAIGPDIDAALAEFRRRVPGLEELVLWGLCDAASAALLHASSNPAVTGMVLLNPWVTESEPPAATLLRHHYLQRLKSVEFWRRVRDGDVSIRSALGGLAATIARAAPRARVGSAEHRRAPAALAERMRAGLEAFGGRVLLVTSGKDLTAAEFLDAVRGSRRWGELLEQDRIDHAHLESANHTFSSAEWRALVERRTLDWLATW